MFNLRKRGGGKTKRAPEGLSAKAAQEETRNILKETIEGAGAIILYTTRVKTSICVEFTMMDQPEERFATGGGGAALFQMLTEKSSSGR